MATPVDDLHALDDGAEPQPWGSPRLPVGRWTVDAERSSISFTARHLLVTKVRGTFSSVHGTIDVAAERERLTKDIAKYEKGVAAADRQLSNEGFLAKAPPQVVEGLKKQASETRTLLEKASAALASLPRD